MAERPTPDLAHIVTRQRELLAELTAVNDELRRALSGVNPPQAQPLSQPTEAPAPARPHPQAQPPQPAGWLPAPGQVPPMAPQPQPHQTRPFPPPRPGQVPPPHPGATPPFTSAAYRPAQPHTYPPTPTRPPAPPFWDRPGAVSRVLAGLGIAVTLMGVALLLTLAWQYGYFEPPAQIIAATLLSLGLSGGGLYIHTKDAANIGAPALLATGIASAYLTVFIATGYYHFLPAFAGLLIAGAIAVDGLWLGRVWRQQWVAVPTLIGVIVLATVLGAQPLMTAAFLLVITATSSLISLDLAWPVLRVVEVIPTALALCLLLLDAPPAAALVIAILFALVNAAVAIWSVRSPASMHKLSVVLMIVAALPLVFVCLAQQSPWDTVGLLGTGLAYTGLVAWQEPRAAALSRTGLAFGASMFALASASYFEGETLLIVIAALAISYLAASTVLGKFSLYVGVALQAIGMAIWISFLSRRWDLTTQPSAYPGIGALIGTLLLIACAWVLISALLANWPAPRTVVVRRVLVGASIMLSSVAILQASVILGRAMGAGLQGLQIGHITVTISWVALSAVALARALRVPNPMASVYTGLALAIASVAKLFLYDLAEQPALVRSLGFLVVGISLLLIGTQYAKALSTAKSHRPVQGPPTMPPTR